MEHKQLISDALIRSPPVNMSFQTDKYMKRSNFLNIPDTIQEQASGELSEESLKMEANETLTNNFDSDDKENNSNQNVNHNESSDSSFSKIIAIDNSFIKKCERKLLDNSNNDEEKNIELENKSAVNKRLMQVPSKFLNETISTPPSALRKEISLLRNELAASDEFHDLEIQLLKEDKSLNDIDLKNYLEVLEKNAELVELYTTLKNEYETYRREQEKMRHELQSKTADCLESLCTQIEASDSSLNISNSFVSFSGGIKSSTMMEDMSEVEATVLHEATVLASDPLSITCNGTFKTPKQTPIRSMKKLFPHESNITKTPIVKEIKEIKDIINKKETTTLLDSEYNLQLLNLETALQDKTKEIELLEKRLFKVEDMSALLKNECESLKEKLKKKTEKLNELTQRLFTETISLNPSLKDSLADVPEIKLLIVFIEAIMEKCKNIQDELIIKHNCEKAEWEIHKNLELATIENLKEEISSKDEKIAELEDLKMSLEKQLSVAESTILTREIELRILQSNVTQTQENIKTSEEEISKLESQLTLIENGKKEIENRCQEFEETIKKLNDELESKEKLLSEQIAEKSLVENLQKEKENLKKIIEESEEIIFHLKSELEKKNELKVEMESLKSKEEKEKFNNLFEVLEEYKKNIREKMSPLSESAFFQFISEKINDSQLLSVVENIRNTLKVENELIIKSNEKEMENVENQCKIFKEQLKENELKLSEILSENDKLKKSCEDLIKKLSETENTILSRDEEIFNLKNLQTENNKEMESKLSKLLVENNDLKKICENLKTQLEEAERVIASRDEDILNSKNVQEQKNSETESKLSTLMLENDEFKKICQDLKTKLQEAEENISSRDEQISNLKKLENERNNENESKLLTISEEMNEFKKICEQLQKQLSEAEKIISTRDEQISNLKKLEDERNNENELKLSEIISENNNFKNLCENLKKQLQEAEEIISSHDKEINNLKQLKSDLSMLNEMETEENVSEKIEKVLKQQENIKNDVEAENPRVVSIFVETLTKTFKGVRNEYIKKIERKQIDFDTQRNIDLNRIESLQVEIKSLEEKSHQQESKISEINLLKEELQQLHNNLTNQLSEAQNTISNYNEELSTLRTNEETIKQIKEELAIADDTILTLRSDLASIESEKVEMETRCQGLEQTIANLTSALETNGNLRHDLDAAKLALENIQNENEKLKNLLEQSEKNHVDLISQEELLQQIESLKLKEKSRFNKLFEILEESKKKLKESFDDEEINVSEETAFGKISEKLAETEDSQLSSAVEAIFNFVEVEWKKKINFYCSQIENFENQIKNLTEKNNECNSKLSEMICQYEEINKCCQHLKDELNEKETRLSLREEEIAILKKQEDVLNDMKEAIALADETISKLNSQLTVIETEKTETQNRCLELEKIIKNVKEELEQKEKLIIELNTVVTSDVENVQKENEKLKEIIENYSQEIESLKRKEVSRFNVLFEVLDEFKTNEMNLTSLTEKINDPQLLSAFETIFNITKTDYESKRKKDLMEIENLENQIKTFDERNIENESKLSKILLENDEFKKICEQLKTKLSEAEKIISTRDEQISNLKKLEDERNNENELKLSEIISENNNFKNLCENLKKQLQEAEEIISSHDKEINNLKQLKSDLSMLNEMETEENVSEKIEKVLKQQENLENDVEAENPRVVSIFVETLTKTFKGVRNEYIKKIERKQIDFDTQRNIDLNRIESLQVEIKSLEEKSHQQESKISEINLLKEELQQLHNNLTNQLSEAQNTISNYNEELSTLRTNEETIKQIEEKLAIADDTIMTLKSELESLESEKVEVEFRCKKLEENKNLLENEIETKETIIKGFEELKVLRERTELENEELKKQMSESEDTINELKKELEKVSEEEKRKDLEIKNLLNEIEILKKEIESMKEFSIKLEKVEKSNKNLLDVFMEIQSHLNLPEETLMKLQSGDKEMKKLLNEKMKNLLKVETEELESEMKNLKLNNENLKEKVKQLSKMLCESASGDMKELNQSQNCQMNLRSRSNKSIDLCVRRLDKLEDINHNLTELLTRVLTMTSFPDLEKLKLCSVRDFPNITKKVIAHINKYESKLKEMKEENAQLDEECETYSNIIKDLKKEAVAVWKSNKEKMEAMETEMSKLKEETLRWEGERQELLSKISKLENDCQKLKSAKAEGSHHNCNCGNETKKINELKRTILIKEQKLLELQELESQITSHKSQIEYLKTALEREKKKVGEEKDKNKKLESELKEAVKNQKIEKKNDENNEILEELRMRGSISGGVVQEFVDKEKMRKLSKDIGILKELCRARYSEIKRLEAVNASLRNNMPKNSNQMDSPLRSRSYNTRSKNPIREVWKSEINGKENSPA